MRIVKVTEVAFNTRTITESVAGESTDGVVFLDSQALNLPDLIYTLPPANTCEGKPKRVICKGAEIATKVTVQNNNEMVGTSEAPPFIMGTVGDFGVFVSDGVSKWYLNEFRIL